MWLPGTYHNGFAPRDGVPRYPSLWRGCIGAWNPGLGPSGLTLRDWSGRGNHGTLTNMAPSTDWVASKNGYVLDYDGSDDTVVIANSARTEPGEKTICAWMYRRTAGNQTLLGRWNTSANRRVIAIYMTSSVIVGGVSSTGLQSSSWEASYSGTLLNAWHHVALTWKANVPAELWIDGKVAATASTAIAALYDSTPEFQIGRMASNNLPFDGLITDAFNFDRVLNPNDIALLARRPGIAYELAPRSRARETSAAAFQASWAYRSNLLLSSGGQW